MLFMGQEWAASSPFLYFTDHHDELGKGVTEGRRKEFADFSDFRDPVRRTLIPDPQALTTFTDSKLIWAQLGQSPHAETLRLYSDFLRFRRVELKDRRRSRWRVDQVSPRVIALRYRRPKEGDILILAQLLANETILELASALVRPAKGRSWRFVISSNEPIYGGERAGLFDPEKNRFLLTGPELIVFCERDKKDK